MRLCCLDQLVLLERGFAAMTSAMAELAAGACRGKLVLLLEGGYDLGALATSVRASVEVLTGRREDFPVGPGPAAARAVIATREALRSAGHPVGRT